MMKTSNSIQDVIIIDGQKSVPKSLKHVLVTLILIFMTIFHFMLFCVDLITLNHYQAFYAIIRHPKSMRMLKYTKRTKCSTLFESNIQEFN